MSPVGFEPTISAGEWPKTYALDRAATGTGSLLGTKDINCEGCEVAQCGWVLWLYRIPLQLNIPIGLETSSYYVFVNSVKFSALKQ